MRPRLLTAVFTALAGAAAAPPAARAAAAGEDRVGEAGLRLAEPVAGGRGNPPRVPDKIDSVVVFADRARVTRARAVPCEKGTARAAFDRLPAMLDVRTLRGEVREAADVIGLASEQVNEKEAADPRARGLAADLDKAENDIKSSEARQAAIAAELEDVGAFAGVFSATLTEEIRNPKPNTPQWAKTLDGLRARRAALADERRKLDVALRGLRLTANKLRRQLAAVGGAGARAYRTAAVTVGCRGLSQVTATVSYVVGGAGWQPEYDIDVTPRGRAKTGPAAARLTVGALVRQATGEDWTKVRLMLSTARPKLGSEAPQPAPLVIDGFEQKRDKVLVQAQERREQLAGGGGGPRGGPQSAALDDKGNAFVLTLPHPITVVADASPVWAPVDVVETQATVKLVATPKLDEHVYQVAALKNPAAYPLLEGRVRSYRGGSYVGDSRLRHQGVGAPFEVSLGIDEELKVERKTLDDKDKAAGLLSSTKHMIHGTRSKLTNRAAGPETVELRENIPVSRIDDVKVELLAKATTGGYQLDAARGFVTWTIKLVNGEWRNIDLAYAIHLPDSWQVPGR
jgi:uncharacterized protein (TIGR02231 family)